MKSEGKDYRFSVEELKIGAVAARNFQPGYERAVYDKKGNPCPAQAISEVMGTYQFIAMTELLWNAVGRPSSPTQVVWDRNHLSYSITERFCGEDIAHSDWWFQNELHRDPQYIAGIFDSIIVCADPTWSSLVGVEPAPVAQMERAVVS